MAEDLEDRVREALAILRADPTNMPVGGVLVNAVNDRLAEHVRWGEALAVLAAPGKVGNTWTRTFAGQILDGHTSGEAIAEAGKRARAALTGGYEGPVGDWVDAKYVLYEGIGHVVGWGETVAEATAMAEAQP